MVIIKGPESLGNAWTMLEMNLARPLIFFLVGGIGRLGIISPSFRLDVLFEQLGEKKGKVGCQSHCRNRAPINIES